MKKKLKDSTAIVYIFLAWFFAIQMMGLNWCIEEIEKNSQAIKEMRLDLKEVQERNERWGEQ